MINTISVTIKNILHNYFISNHTQDQYMWKRIIDTLILTENLFGQTIK